MGFSKAYTRLNFFCGKYVARARRFFSTAINGWLRLFVAPGCSATGALPYLASLTSDYEVYILDEADGQERVAFTLMGTRTSALASVGPKSNRRNPHAFASVRTRRNPSALTTSAPTV
jgi:hypothetical protein